jgi:hypothetical protein
VLTIKFVSRCKEFLAAFFAQPEPSDSGKFASLASLASFAAYLPFSALSAFSAIKAFGGFNSPRSSAFGSNTILPEPPPQLENATLSVYSFHRSQNVVIQISQLPSFYHSPVICNCSLGATLFAAAI